MMDMKSHASVLGKGLAAAATMMLVMSVTPSPSVAVQAQAPAKAAEKNARPFSQPNGRVVQPRRPVKQGVLDLEDAISRAELIVTVRLVEMTEAKIVHGGKTEVVTQQFRFEPVRTLKGIFARDALLLTGQDLGIYQFTDGADRLERGQMLLLLLGRQAGGYFNCNTAGSLEQSIPRLSGQNDPLLPAVESLIAVTQRPDREAKVTTLLAALEKAKDRDAVPLLLSLRRRALLAAQTPNSVDVVSKFLAGASPEVREISARTLTAILDADYLQQPELRERAVKGIVASLEAAGPDLAMRVAATDAMGALGEAAQTAEPVQAWLRADQPAATFAEQAARLRAIGRIGRKDQRDAIVKYLAQLPMDSPSTAQTAAYFALSQVDGKEAVSQLAKRLASKSDAGIGIADELTMLGSFPRELAAPALLDAFPRAEDHAERLAFAGACVNIADPRLVPSLALLLDPRHPDVRWQATEALRKIDTDEAASVVWPSLSQESDLVRKLQLAEFLGRHGFRGGYPYAIEHITAPMLQEAAVAALAAIREPKAVPELKKIWESSNDLGWNTAAIRALGRLGHAEIAPRLLEMARDLKQPLAVPALLALGDLGEVKAIPMVREGLNSRSDATVIAAIRASRKLLAAPEAKADDVRDRLAALLADSDTAQPVRDAALEVLVSLDDPRLGKALAAAVRDSGLENTELLAHVEEQLTKRKEKLALK